MDWKKKVPGTEFSLNGYSVNGFKYRNDGRALVDVKAGGEHGIASAIVRYIDGKKILYTNGMTCNFMNIYRFIDGTDLCVPAGLISQSYNMNFPKEIQFSWPSEQPFDKDPGKISFIWRDLNGDGEYTENEYVQTNFSYQWNFCVDSKGNIWENGNPIICRKFAGFDQNGCPIYDDAHTETFQLQGVGGTSRVIFQEEFDRMVVTQGGSNREIFGADVFVIDKWSTGNRTARHVCNLRSPETAGLTVVDHYILDNGYANSKVYITDLDNGQSVGELETDGRMGFTGTVDIGHGVSAFKRPTGEIVVFEENNYRANVLLFRWTPPGEILLPEDETAPAAPGELTVVGDGAKITLGWKQSGEKDLGVYCVYRSKTPDVKICVSQKIAHGLSVNSFVDTRLDPAAQYWYAVTALDKSGNESPLSAVVSSNGGSIAVKRIGRFAAPQFGTPYVKLFTMQGRALTSYTFDYAKKSSRTSTGCFIAVDTKDNRYISRKLVVQ
jgi:hypothetical protein